MIVDTSALIALLLSEPDAERIAIAMRHAPARISSATYVELGVVCDSKGVEAWPKMERLLAKLGVTLEPLTAVQARIARNAHHRYGRGSGHPARLNFGDTFSYALAKDRGEPLLCKGGDFARTDVAIAAY